MSINSRRKGAAGEREFAELLREFGITARRGVQYSGLTGQADVVSSLAVHWEVKRVQNLNIYDAMNQALRDSQNTQLLPVVAWRRNGKKWLGIVEMERLLPLLLKYNSELNAKFTRKNRRNKRS